MCLTNEGSETKINGAHETIICDLKNEKEILKASNVIEKTCEGSLWAIVHNAFIVIDGFIDFQDLDNYRETMEVNFFAIVSLNQKLLLLVKSYSLEAKNETTLISTEPRMVIVISVGGLVSLPGNAPYDASNLFEKMH